MRLLVQALFVLALATAASLSQLLPIFSTPELQSSRGRPAPVHKSVTLSAAESALVEREILPAASQHWTGVAGCDPSGANGFRLIGTLPSEGGAAFVAEGSFTRPRANQKAVLYTYCMVGHNFANNGLVIFEADQVAAHVVYEGGWDESLQALPNIDDDGQSEILIVTGGTRMGESFQRIAIIGLSEKGVRTFGQTESYSGDCESGSVGFQTKTFKGQETTYKLFVKKGSAPAFYRETFVGDCGEPTKWRKSAAAHRIDLENSGKYVRLK